MEELWKVARDKRERFMLSLPIGSAGIGGGKLEDTRLYFVEGRLYVPELDGHWCDWEQNPLYAVERWAVEHVKRRSCFG